MKSLVQALVVSAVLATPFAALAQSNAPLTRAQVRDELVQVEKAGYVPTSSTVNYPADIQAAQARVVQQQALAAADTSGTGHAAAGQAQSGRSADVRDGLKPTYFGQ
jgi:hypothetical protein